MLSDSPYPMAVPFLAYEQHSNVYFCLNMSLKMYTITVSLAGVAQWIERGLNQRAASSIPSLGTCLGCRPGPSVGLTRGNHTLFLSLSFSSSSSLSKDKLIKSFLKCIELL